MFVSYKVEDTYGYMCFGGSVEVEGLKKYVEDRLFRKINLMYVSKYSNARSNYVWIHTDKIFRTIQWDKALSNVEDIGNLYVYLYRKYGFTNILGFLPNEISKNKKI